MYLINGRRRYEKSKTNLSRIQADRGNKIRGDVFRVLESKDKNPIRKYIYETDYSPYGDKEIKPFDDYWYFRTREDAERKATWLRNLMTEKKWTKRIIRSIQVVEVRKVITEAIIIEAPAGEIQKKEAAKIN